MYVIVLQYNIAYLLSVIVMQCILLTNVSNCIAFNVCRLKVRTYVIQPLCKMAVYIFYIVTFPLWTYRSFEKSSIP